MKINTDSIDGLTNSFFINLQSNLDNILYNNLYKQGVLK